MPVITEEGFDTLQESAIQEDPSVTAGASTGDEKISESETDQPPPPSEPSDIDTEGVTELVPSQPLDVPALTEKGDSVNLGDDNDDEDDEDLDETLAERLWGLTEMFPESIRNITSQMGDVSCSLLKNSYSFSCNAAWIVASSATILVLPVMFELERAQMEQQQLQQQRQILLGPNAASSGPGPAMPGPPR